jgi:hypothetical protein
MSATHGLPANRKFVKSLTKGRSFHLRLMLRILSVRMAERTGETQPVTGDEVRSSQCPAMKPVIN